jgi:phosphoglucomutase
MRGQEEIAEMMQAYRDNPPTHINNSPVLEILDYQTQIVKNL